MSNQRFFLLAIGLALTLVLACDILESTVMRDTPTPDRVPSRVAEIKTSEAIETRARATLMAEVSTETLKPTIILPTTTPATSQRISPKQGEWEGRSVVDVPFDIDIGQKDCSRDRFTNKLTTCPEFSIYFAVHEDARVTVRNEDYKFRPRCVKPGQEMRPFGFNIGIYGYIGATPTNPSVTATNDGFQFIQQGVNGQLKVLGRVIAPDRIEGTYYATAFNEPFTNFSCEEAHGVWTASPK